MGASYLPVHLLPLFIALWLPVSFIITYSIAVAEDHVYPWLPSISATGTTPPESCCFSLFLNFAVFLMVLAGYIRHVQLREYALLRPNNTPNSWLNMTASMFGLVAMAGLYIVANWQLTAVYRVHFTGAEICFICATIYFIFQTVFSFWMAPEFNSLLLFMLRIPICVFMIVFNVTCVVSNIIALDAYKITNFSRVLYWTPDYPGYSWHLAYSISEWCLVITFCLGILTFSWDFKKVQLEEPMLQVKSKWSTDSYNFD